MKYKALIVAGSFSEFPDQGISRLKSAGIEAMVGPVSGPEQESEVLKIIPDFHAFFISGGKFCSKPIIQAGKNLRVIAVCGTGYDGADLKSATQAGIVVVNSPTTGSTEAVAELVIAFIFSLARGICRQNSLTRVGQTERFVGMQVWGKTLGIAGLGRIGKSVAKRAFGLGMKICACDKYPDAEFSRKYRIDYVDLKTLLSRSDFVTLNLNLSEEARHIIGKKELSLMKPTAYLINTGRGELVDQFALYQVLKEKRIAGAGLDVIEESLWQEKFRELDNVICTPHLGNRTYEGIHEVIDLAVSQVISVLEGKQPEFILRN